MSDQNKKNHPGKVDQGKGSRNKADQGTEKIVTKYDRKVERRKAAKEREAREKKRTATITAVVVIAIVAWIASYPILTYVHRNEVWVRVNGQDVTREEFDYYFSNVATNSGVDPSGDLEAQTYSDTMSMKDYLEQQTVENLKTFKGVAADAKAAGFVYDAATEIENFEDTVRDNAKSAGLSVGKYVKQRYGTYAVMGDVKKYVEENALISAYMNQKEEEFKPSEEEIEAYYEENPSSYDAVDYYMEVITAQLPEEDPTEEQIQAAMNEAADQANTALGTIEQSGELMTGDMRSDVYYLCADWLFDESRKEKDQTVIEDTEGHAFYVLRFVNRYRKEDATANIYAIITEDKNGQQILDEWNAGEASEERFREFVKKYDVSGSVDGYYENMTQDGLISDLGDWIFAENRQVGDVGYVPVEGSDVEFVIYYAGEGEVYWKAEIIAAITSKRQTEYEESFGTSVTVENVKGHLNYLNDSAESENAADGDATGAENETATDGDATGAENETATGGDATGAESETATGEAVTDAETETATETETGSAAGAESGTAESSQAQ